MLWWLLLLAAIGFIGWFLRAFAMQADEIEDDTSYVYEHRSREPYGSIFLNILMGRGDQDDQ